MVINKISERLLKIINQEITEISIEIPSHTNDDLLNSPKDNKNNQKATTTPDSTIKLPVYIDDYIPVIITFTSAAQINSESVKKILSGVDIKYEYTLIPAIAANVTETQIRKLSDLDKVSLIEFDEYVTETLDTARKWFGVDKTVQTFDLTGNEKNPHTFNKYDNTIAILDSGIDINHVDLGSGKVIGWHDEINPSTTTPYDDRGHGTHVASIAAGLGKSICDYRGVAPGAALVGVKVLNSLGSGSLSQVIAGIQWCIANKNTYGIRVINMSLSGPSNAAVRNATTAAVNNGIVVVCSAGNSGPSLNSIGSPGNTPDAITVGNMADVGQGGYFLVRSSSRGPGFAGNIKPDLVAPGYNITAAKAGTTNEYSIKSGTSMSSPFVAGVVALMLDADNSLTPNKVKEILQESAEPWGFPQPNNDYGYGRLRAFAALSKVYEMCENNYYKPCCNSNSSCKNSCVLNKNHLPFWGNSCCPNNYLKYMHLCTPVHFSATRTIATPDESDWYEFYVTTLGYPVGITLLALSAAPPRDIDLYVYNYNNNVPIASSLSYTSRQETITFVPNYCGKYLIRVQRFSGNSIRYQLDLSVFGDKFRWFETTN